MDINCILAELIEKEKPYQFLVQKLWLRGLITPNIDYGVSIRTESKLWFGKDTI